MQRFSSLRTVKLGAALLIALMCLAIHLLDPHFFPYLMRMLAHGDILETADYIRSFGSWAVFFSFWLTLFVNTIGFPPAIIFSTANTLIFGIVPGIVLSCVAETAGVTVSFLLLRFFFRDTAQALIGRSKALSRLDHYSGEKGFFVMLVARMVPYFPSGILNAVGALSSLGLRDYALASFIGKFPSTGIEAIIGHDALTHQEDHTRLVLVILFALLLIGGALWFQKKHLGEKPPAR